MLDSELLPGSPHRIRIQKPSRLPWFIAGLASATCVWVLATRGALSSTQPWVSNGAPSLENPASLAVPPLHFPAGETGIVGAITHLEDRQAVSQLLMMHASQLLNEEAQGQEIIALRQMVVELGSQVANNSGSIVSLQRSLRNGSSSAASLLADQITVNNNFNGGGPAQGWPALPGSPTAPSSPSPPSPPRPFHPIRSYHFMHLNGFGNTAPTSTEAYVGSSLAGSVTLDHGVQEWVVPISGNYQISAAGASTFGSQLISYRGRGAAVSGVFHLNAGTHLKVLVGQMGLIYANNDGGAGGGGASWVWIADADEPLLVAGGAGGSREQNLGTNPLQYISGTVNGHTRTHCLDGRLLTVPFDEHCANDRDGGYSRAAHCDGGGGGGWSRDGDHGGENAEGGHKMQGSSTTPGAGGNSGGCGGHDSGGFGGGGAGGFDAGGGGGGYIGGDGGQYGAPYLPGTGGSSYVNEANLYFTVADFWNDANGLVKVELWVEEEE